MVTKFIVLVASLIVTSAFADTKKDSPRKPSSESKITIKAFPNKYSGWFVERTQRGVMGGILSRVVPVTREASATLKNHDPNKTYQCDFTDSTFAGKYDEDLAGNYFVIDLTCK
jgi:hypothetical protein